MTLRSVRHDPFPCAWRSLPFFSCLFIGLPLITVFVRLSLGLGAYRSAITDSVSLAAVRLTLLTAAIAVPST
jgi:sulfate transport system permease protein